MLTKRQQQVLAFIEACIDRDGYPPTRNQIGKRFGIRGDSARDHLENLRDKGVIDWLPGCGRSIRVLNRKHRCPHCGREI